MTNSAKATNDATSLVPSPAPRSAPTIVKAARPPLLLGRRVAVAALVSAISASLLTWLWVRPGPGPEPKPERMQTPPWVAPHHWDDYGAGVRNVFLTIDQNVYNMEQQGQQSYLMSMLSAMLASPGDLQAKTYVVSYVMDTGKGQYIPGLLTGLQPAVSPPTLRRLILGTIELIASTQGGSGIPVGTTTSLQSYQASGVENDPSVINVLTRVLRVLGPTGN